MSQYQTAPNPDYSRGIRSHETTPLSNPFYPTTAKASGYEKSVPGTYALPKSAEENSLSSLQRAMYRKENDKNNNNNNGLTLSSTGAGVGVQARTNNKKKLIISSPPPRRNHNTSRTLLKRTSHSHNVNNINNNNTGLRVSAPTFTPKPPTNLLPLPPPPGRKLLNVSAGGTGMSSLQMRAAIKTNQSNNLNHNNSALSATATNSPSRPNIIPSKGRKLLVRNFDSRNNATVVHRSPNKHNSGHSGHSYQIGGSGYSPQVRLNGNNHHPGSDHSHNYSTYQQDQISVYNDSSNAAVQRSNNSSIATTIIPQTAPIRKTEEPSFRQTTIVETKTIRNNTTNTTSNEIKMQPKPTLIKSNNSPKASAPRKLVKDSSESSTTLNHKKNMIQTKKNTGDVTTMKNQSPINKTTVASPKKKKNRISFYCSSDEESEDESSSLEKEKEKEGQQIETIAKVSSFTTTTSTTNILKENEKLTNQIQDLTNQKNKTEASNEKLNDQICDLEKRKEKTVDSITTVLGILSTLKMQHKTVYSSIDKQMARVKMALDENNEIVQKILSKQERSIFSYSSSSSSSLSIEGFDVQLDAPSPSCSSSYDDLQALLRSLETKSKSTRSDVQTSTVEILDAIAQQSKILTHSLDLLAAECQS